MVNQPIFKDLGLNVFLSFFLMVALSLQESFTLPSYTDWLVNEGKCKLDFALW
jgi:hypothetical protein